MRDNMAVFFSNQLDFIFFFYGLAFILLGVTCFAISRSRGRGESWAVLGWFAVAHGAGEWLDLTALIIGTSMSSTLVIKCLAYQAFSSSLFRPRVPGISR